MPVLPLSQWNGDFRIDDVRMQKDRLNRSAVLPPIAFVTGLCKITDTDASRWIELQLSAAERNKLQEIEERILKAQPDNDMEFRSSMQDGRLEVWLEEGTTFYSPDRELLPERPLLEVGTIVRAHVLLSELSFAKTQFGALWRADQMWLPRAKFVFDDAEDVTEQAEASTDDIDLKLPSRVPQSVAPLSPDTADE